MTGLCLMAGFSCFGAAVAIALVGSAVQPVGGERPLPGSPPSMAIVHMAFCMGLAVLGIVAVLLGATLGPTTTEWTASLFAAIPAAAGTMAAIGILGREEIDARISRIAMGFAAAIGGLGVVAAILVIGLTGEGTASPPDWPFPILGAIVAAAALAIGITGRAALVAMQGSAPDAAAMIYRRQVARIAILDAIGVGAMSLAIALVILA